MKIILYKMIQVGKVIVFCTSLVAMLILTPLSPTALAANPGDPLRLGEENSISGATTSLVGNSNSTLELVNRAPTGDGSPALSLVVNPKVPPLVVNDTAGKAINLNADRLDGRDSTMFADGTNGKANDSDKLDGRDSITFADAINGKANDADKLDGRDSTTFADGINGKANDADKLDGRDSNTFADAINGKANDADKLDGRDSNTFADGINGKAKDADKLDGHDSTTFATGTNGKANSAFSADNADKLDGKDSLQFWSGKSYSVFVANNGQIVAGNVYSVDASCDTGDTLLHVGGGSTSAGDNKDAIVRISVFSSPTSGITVPHTGKIYVRKSLPATLMYAEVICADFPPLR